MTLYNQCKIHPFFSALFEEVESLRRYKSVLDIPLPSVNFTCATVTFMLSNIVLEQISLKRDVMCVK